MEKLWLFLFAAMQAIGALFSTFGYFGITSDKLHMLATQSPWWLAAAVVLFSGSLGTVFYALRRPLVIHSAIYGSGLGGLDFTAKLRCLVHDGRASFKVGNDLFGDPRPEEFKHLTVGFSYRGNRQTKIVQQDHWCNLP